MENLVTSKFKDLFTTSPSLFKAPGRINLIGEHTDYNLGFVLPAAIDHGIFFAVAESTKNYSTFYSMDMDEQITCDVNNLRRGEGWYNYLSGVIAELQKLGANVRQLNVVFAGNIPMGAGLSSSAALECGFAYAINAVFGLGFDPLTLVKASQMAEHNFVGVKCGIMDQFASMMGKQDCVIRLDCEDLSYDYFPLELKDYTIVLCNSKVSHNLASSEYNVRREQCERGVKILNDRFGNIKFLRDTNFDQLKEVKQLMPEVVYRRCKYILEENERVRSFAEALTKGNLQKAGSILNEGQLGMQQEYEITCPEIDFLAAIATQKPYVLGARMMGGGFGGCTVNLIDKNSKQQFSAEISEAYLKQYGKKPDIIEVVISEGVHQLG